MAALASVVGMVVSIKRNKDGSRGSAFGSKNQDFGKMIFSFPKTNECEACYPVKMLMLDGSWQPIQIAWTKSIIALGKVGDDTLIDAVPLDEVFGIHLMQEGSLHGLASQHATNQCESITSTADISNADNVQNNSKPSLLRQSSAIWMTLTSQKGGDRSPISSAQSKEVQTQAGKGLSGKQGVFVIMTDDEGYNSGRKYYFQANSDFASQQIVDVLARRSKAAKITKQAKGKLARIRERVAAFIKSDPFQYLFAFLITMNFGSNVVQMQLNNSLTNDDGSLNRTGRILDILDFFFTLVFAVELSLNMFAHWFRPYFNDGWNWFDLIVVSLSLVALGPLPVPVVVIRSMRAFRIARLFRRIRSLSGIIMALTASIIPVINAYLVLLIAMCIYAIMGVTFFSDESAEHFGVFDRSLLTMFRVTSGEAWADFLSPLDEDGAVRFGTCLFFVSYTLIVCWTLLQVSVAVLIDKFVSATALIKFDEVQKAMSERKAKEMVKNALDPLLEVLSEDVHPRLHLTEEDISTLVGDESKLKNLGYLNKSEFEWVMCRQLELYIQRQLSDLLVDSDAAALERVQTQTLKMILMQLLRSQTQNDLAPDNQQVNIGAELHEIRMLLSGQCRAQISGGCKSAAAFELKRGDKASKKTVGVARTGSLGLKEIAKQCSSTAWIRMSTAICLKNAVNFQHKAHQNCTLGPALGDYGCTPVSSENGRNSLFHGRRRSKMLMASTLSDSQPLEFSAKTEYDMTNHTKDKVTAGSLLETAGDLANRLGSQVGQAGDSSGTPVSEQCETGKVREDVSSAHQNQQLRERLAFSALNSSQQGGSMEICMIRMENDVNLVSPCPVSTAITSSISSLYEASREVRTNGKFVAPSLRDSSQKNDNAQINHNIERGNGESPLDLSHLTSSFAKSWTTTSLPQSNTVTSIVRIPTVISMQQRHGRKQQTGALATTSAPETANVTAAKPRTWSTRSPSRRCGDSAGTGFGRHDPLTPSLQISQDCIAEGADGDVAEDNGTQGV